MLISLTLRGRFVRVDGSWIGQVMTGTTEPTLVNPSLIDGCSPNGSGTNLLLGPNDYLSVAEDMATIQRLANAETERQLALAERIAAALERCAEHLDLIERTMEARS